MGMIQRGDGAGFPLEALIERSAQNLIATIRSSLVSRAL